MSTNEPHRTARIGWLRAAVLGANDAIISISSLMVGVAAAASSQRDVLLAGVAGLAAGTLSMAAGEYVSVSSQSDTERAERDREAQELLADPASELRELTAIYVARGLTEELAAEVARQLTDRNALEAHARDELGLSDVLSARPLQAALASAASFGLGAVLPLTAAIWAPPAQAAASIVAVTLVSLFALGLLSAWIGGAPKLPAALRVTFWGALAMGATAAVGRLFGVA